MRKKDIIVFGTGEYFENYMVCNGPETGRMPAFAVDNDPARIGSRRLGVEVKSPEVLRELNRDSFYVVICCAGHEEIGRQLEAMGIWDYQYYRPVPVEDVCGPEGAAESKAYRTGYVPGVFDLFHIGHLNLLRRSKSRCEYLIAGVLTDELVEYFKRKKPVIPYAQRAAIVGAVCYVDRVVPVDFSNTYKIDAWKRYHFDCHFSGNDHGADWSRDLEQLRAVGSNMEFFEYTRAVSSTMIKEKVR